MQPMLLPTSTSASTSPSLVSPRRTLVPLSLVVLLFAVACATAPPPPAVVIAPAAADEEPDEATETAPVAAPAQVEPDPLAIRLCDALFTVPAARREACCGFAGPSLAQLCAGELSAAIQRGTVEIDPAAVDRCVAATAAELVGCDWVTPLLPPLPAACERLVGGRLAEGSPCRSALECADGLRCRGLTRDAAGVCAPPTPVRTACERTLDPLAAYTRSQDDPRHPACEGRCAGGQCLPIQNAGDRCVVSALCPAGTRCVDGRCDERPLAELGEPCDPTLGCEPGSVCDDGACIVPKPAGAPCQLPFECRALACAKAPGEALGRCADPCLPLAGSI